MKAMSEGASAPSGAATKQPLLVLGTNAAKRQSLREQFERRGHEVTVLRRADEATRELRRRSLAAAVIDLEGLGDAGLALIRDLRDQSAIPILVLTEATEDVVEIIALKYGADLVVRSDCAAMLIAERLAALLRRDAMARLDSEAEYEIMLRGDLTIDLSRFAVTWKGEPVVLTRTEFSLLQFLAARPGHVRTREQIYDEIYGGSIYVLDRTIDSHIKRIRSKLRSIDPDFDAIDTLYGMGYRFNLESETALAS